MSITGLVVRARPERADRVAEIISGIDGVEVHTVTGEGRLVVTVDNLDDAAAAKIFDNFQDIEGVLNTSLVYTRFENDLADKEQEP